MVTSSVVAFISSTLLIGLTGLSSVMALLLAFDVLALAVCAIPELSKAGADLPFVAAALRHCRAAEPGGTPLAGLAPLEDCTRDPMLG